MRIPMKTKYFSWLFLIIGALSLSGCGFKPSPQAGYQVSLEIWGVFDDSDVYSELISEYRRINPYIKDIQYRKLSPETYKEDLIDALAAGKGPDIFMIRNSWRGAFENKTAPAPDTLLNEKEYRGALVDVAASDFIAGDNKIYGIPASVDSLALYYNKDLFNAAGISNPPATWDEVMADARQLNTIDQFGSITRSGIALGTGQNINRSSDILTVMMMQLGSEVSNPSRQGQVTLFDDGGRKALDFYTQFSRIGSPVYSWNAREHYSIDAFYEGTLAMMINYSWQYETIKQKNAKLSIGIAPLPQFQNTTPVNLANYWGYAVAKDKPTTVTPTGQGTAPFDTEKQNYLRTFESWQFLKFLAMPHTNKTMTMTNGLTGTTKDVSLGFDPTSTYLNKTHKPAARRDIVTEQQNDVVLSSFVYGNLIAKNKYQGNSEGMDGILIDMIDNVVRGEKSAQDALTTATSRINLLTR